MRRRALMMGAGAGAGLFFIETAPNSNEYIGFAAADEDWYDWYIREGGQHGFSYWMGYIEDANGKRVCYSDYNYVKSEDLIQEGYYYRVR